MLLELIDSMLFSIEKDILKINKLQKKDGESMI